MLLANKVAIVTGGARGIGRATVERLAREGARVVVADIDDEAGAKVVAAVKAAGSEAVFRSADISERLDVFNLVASARDAFGKIDVLVNNAAIVDDQPFLELEEGEFDRVMRTNIKGAFLASQAVAKQMIRQRQADPNCQPGSIVNVTSVNARFGQSDHLAYAVSKGGLEQLTRSMALALAPYGIRVNAVGPGTVETDMIAQVYKDEAWREAVLSRTPLGRFGTPAEIAAVIAWLASKEASYLTGTTIWADGGRMSLNAMMPASPEADT
ncbi:MAG: SDR family oxidoreductase [Hyphomicrobiaceae bacterium]|nr:SDR family oxidoreductase [Hyphomicrobiaceae bacterium]